MLKSKKQSMKVLNMILRKFLRKFSIT